MSESDRNRAWLAERSPWSQRIMRFGLWGFLIALGIGVVQHWIWLLAGWGSANFMPNWALLLIYAVALCVGLSFFYAMLAKTAALEGAAQWGTSLFAGSMAFLFVVAALAGSLPQLSTLIVSRPVSIDLPVYSKSDNRACRGGVWFGPLYRAPGRMCTGFEHWPKGSTQTFYGQGHAFAVRLEGY